MVYVPSNPIFQQFANWEIPIENLEYPDEFRDFCFSRKIRIWKFIERFETKIGFVPRVCWEFLDWIYQYNQI